MDESKRYEIAVLAEAMHEKRERLEMMGMANTPSDPDERRKATIEIELARAEYYEALGALWRARDGLTAR